MTFKTYSAKHVKLQRVRLPPDGRASWLVLDDMYQPIRPIQAFVVYMTQMERSRTPSEPTPTISVCTGRISLKLESIGRPLV